jgi:hypothetical protein
VLENPSRREGGVYAAAASCPVSSVLLTPSFALSEEEQCEVLCHAIGPTFPVWELENIGRCVVGRRVLLLAEISLPEISLPATSVLVTKN